jgi:sec-independent protein translocase protein TatB
MFDIGFTELLLVAVVALVVLGPERLPKAARFAGLWVRRARAQWYSVKSEFEREIAAEELKRSLQEMQDTAREVGQRVETGMQDLDAQVREAEADARREVEAMRRQVETGPQDDAPPVEADLASSLDEALLEPDPPQEPAPAQPEEPEQPDLLEQGDGGDDGRQR